MNRVFVVLFALLLVLSSLFALSSCSARRDSVIVSYSPFEATALIWIAEDRQFFTRNGLDVTFRKYDTGPGALDGVLNGEADIVAGVGEFPLVGNAFRKARIRALATIARSEFIYLVGRKDRGIESISDLKGKRVGTTFGTVAEFHLGRFLDLNGLSMREVSLVDLKTPAEWVDAVANGDVDAVATAQPHARNAAERLGANATVWSAQSRRPLFLQVAATDEWIAGHPKQARKFLKALLQAEDYASRNPAESEAVVQKRLGLDPAYMETVWGQNEFGLSLDLSFVLAMEDEARWMMANKLTAEKEVPDFLKYIYEDPLKTLKPQAVTIIR